MQKLWFHLTERKIAFTSIRTGDLEIYVMDIDGSNLKQITSGLGYDGGCFFSHDSKKIVFVHLVQKQLKRLKNIKICWRKTWLHHLKWKFTLATSMVPI